VDTFYGNVGG